MIVGYSFVYPPSADVHRLSCVDGMAAILGVAGYPLRILSFEVESIRDAEAMAGASLQRERHARKKRSRNQLQEQFPKEVTIRIAPEHRLVGGMLATVLDVSGRHTGKAVVEYLVDLFHVDRRHIAGIQGGLGRPFHVMLDQRNVLPFEYLSEDFVVWAERFWPKASSTWPAVLTLDFFSACVDGTAATAEVAKASDARAAITIFIGSLLGSNLPSLNAGNLA